jgi:dolichol-phosphate mannosyltransferase
MISVVVPVYNELGNIEPLVAEVREALSGRMNYELVFVDDGSQDGTRELIGRLASEDEAVVALLHPDNRGQSAAVRTGVKAARHPVIAVLDGDGQNDPRDIPKLVGQLAMVPRLSMVIGERRNRKDSWSRLLSSKVANKVRSKLLGDGVRDTGCGIKVFYRDQYLDLPAFDHMHRFLPALMQRYGGGVCSVPVNHRPRLSGTSKYGVGNRLWVGITDMLGVMWLQRRRI